MCVNMQNTYRQHTKALKGQLALCWTCRKRAHHPAGTTHQQLDPFLQLPRVESPKHKATYDGNLCNFYVYNNLQQSTPFIHPCQPGGAVHPQVRDQPILLELASLCRTNIGAINCIPHCRAFHFSIPATQLNVNGFDQLVHLVPQQVLSFKSSTLQNMIPASGCKASKSKVQ